MKRFCAASMLLFLLLSACADPKSGTSVSVPETAPIAWPAELLPDGFPVAEHLEIYSVKQTDDTVQIILFAEKGPVFTMSTVMLFQTALEEQGYRVCRSYSDFREDSFLINRDGYRVRIDTSSNFEGELTEINKYSPTGYTYSVTVQKTNEDVGYLFVDYPAPDANLGLEERVFDTWPAEYLPAGIPMPCEGITMGKMEMRKNGLMITITGSDESTGRYLDSILQTGFLIVDNTCIGKNGDYFYIRTLSYPPIYGGDITLQLQFCKYTEQS